jgi:flagellar transcriptional activator FlhD
MIDNDELKNIHILNLSYLLLAQRLINEDRIAAKFRLGIDDAMVKILEVLTLPQLVKLSETNQIICQFRFECPELISKITSESRIDDKRPIHTGILLATQLYKNTRSDMSVPSTGDSYV